MSLKTLLPPPQKIKMIKHLPIINTIVYEINNVCKIMSRMRLGRKGILWTSGDMWNSPVRRRPASVWCWTAWPPTTSAPRTLTSSISSTTSSKRKSCQRKRPSSSSMTLSASWRVYTRCVVMGFSDLGVLEWCFIFTIVEKQLSLDCMSYELSNFVPANIMLFYWWYNSFEI